MQRADGVYYFWDFAYNYTHMLRSYPSASQIMMLRASPPRGIYMKILQTPRLSWNAEAARLRMHLKSLRLCRLNFLTTAASEVWHKTVGAAAMDSTSAYIYKNKHFRKPNSALIWWAVRKKIDLYIQQWVLCKIYIHYLVCAQSMTCAIGFLFTAALLYISMHTGARGNFLGAIEFGGAKLIKCHAQRKCDDKWPPHERLMLLRLQIIDSADIYLFKTPYQKKRVHTQYAAEKRERAFCCAMLTFIPKSRRVLAA